MNLEETQASSDTHTGPTVICRFLYYRSGLGSAKFSGIQMMTQIVYNPCPIICNCRPQVPAVRFIKLVLLTSILC